MIPSYFSPIIHQFLANGKLPGGVCVQRVYPPDAQRRAEARFLLTLKGASCLPFSDI
jgi:hypothetical protein